MHSVHYETRDNVIFVTINRPEKRNALNPNLVNELKAAFEKAKNDESGKTVVLRANGSTFCAGADLAYISQLRDYSEAENLQDSRNLLSLFKLIYEHPKVVIAQIEGHAIAGGCGLATVCDFAFAIPEAKFGYTEVRIGFIPAIVSIFLVRKVGESLSRRLLLSGELFSAEAAEKYGLLHRVAEKSVIEKTVLDFAKKLNKQNAASSMEWTKKLLAGAWDRPLDEGLDWAAEMNAKARKTPDCIKGVDAFLQKQTPDWS